VHGAGGPFAFHARWVGTAVALALLAGMGGFLCYHDYQKVRVLRTFEQWVNGRAIAGRRNRPKVAERSVTRQVAGVREETAAPPIL
jgi:hypothetical protein